MVNLFIRSFAKIDDVKMEYSVQITFRQKWSDDRLTYKHKLGHGDMQSESLAENRRSTDSILISGRIKYLTMTDAKKVWMPDTFFRNEKEGRFHNILVPNVYIRIFPDGYVLYSIRYFCAVISFLSICFAFNSCLNCIFYLQSLADACLPHES